MFRETDPGSLRRGRIRYFPVAPGRLEFAALLRQELLREKPAVVAVELPVTLEKVYERAISRLPELSVITYEDEGQDRAIYLPVESYRVTPQPRSQELAVHAEGLAWKLQGVDPEATVVAVVSLNLLDPLLEAMEHPQTQPLRKVKRRGVQVLNLHPECLAEVLTEMPFLQAVYEARRKGEALKAVPEVETRQVHGFSVVASSAEDPKVAAVTRASQEPLDRQQLHFRLFSETERQYQNNTGEEVAHWQRRLWARYTRNLALVSPELCTAGCT